VICPVGPLVDSLSRDRQIPTSRDWIDADDGDLAIPYERVDAALDK
jgi:hypothetical protein